MRNWNTPATWSRIVAWSLKGCLILLAGWIVITLCFWVLTMQTAPEGVPQKKSVTAMASQYIEKNKSLLVRKLYESKALMRNAYWEGKAFVQKTLKNNQLLFQIGIGVLILFVGRLVLNSADYLSEKTRLLTDRFFLYLRKLFQR